MLIENKKEFLNSGYLFAALNNNILTWGDSMLVSGDLYTIKHGEVVKVA